MQLQLQHNSNSTLGRTQQQDEELSRLNYRMEVMFSESERQREVLERTQQELGDMFTRSLPRLKPGETFPFDETNV